MKLRMIGLGFIAIGALSGGLMLKDRFTRNLAQYGKIPEFKLVSHEGEEFSEQDLKGKVWLVNFFFTRCHGPCPRLTQKQQEMQSTLLPFKNLRHLSITSDPEYDTVEQLSSYAKNYSAVTGRWFFLGGSKDTILSLAKSAFKVVSGEEPDMHSTRIILIDKEGEVRGYYDSADPKALVQLRRDATYLTKL